MENYTLPSHALTPFCLCSCSFPTPNLSRMVSSIIHCRSSRIARHQQQTVFWFLQPSTLLKIIAGTYPYANEPLITDTPPTHTHTLDNKLFSSVRLPDKPFHFSSGPPRIFTLFFLARLLFLQRDLIPYNPWNNVVSLQEELDLSSPFYISLMKPVGILLIFSLCRFLKDMTDFLTG